MSRVLYATDLDRTLIYSVRSAGVPVDELIPVERYLDRDISFVSPRQVDLLAALAARCLVVPVTTRTRAQYDRVTVWSEPPAWAVVANGATVLRHGRPDGDWAASVRAELDDGCESLDVVAGWLAVAAGPWIDHVRVADGVFLYTLVDRATLPPAVATEWEDHLSGIGWRLSIQGRKLYAVPAPLRKSAAVGHVASAVGAAEVYAAGDSLLDLDLLRRADRSLRPAHGELHDLALAARGDDLALAAGGDGPAEVADVVTTGSGTAAGEELLATVLAWVDGVAGPMPGPSRAGAGHQPEQALGAPGRDEVLEGAGGSVSPVPRAPEARTTPA